MSEIEFLVKLRDGLQMAVDGITEYLEKMAPADRPSWDPGKIAWKEADGTKGPYELAEPQATPDFRGMVQDLKEHDGKLAREGYFYWVFSDMARVGRKKKSKIRRG